MGLILPFTLQSIPPQDTFGNSNSTLSTPTSFLPFNFTLFFLFIFCLGRLKPGCEACIEEVEAEVKCNLEKLEWLPGFFSLPPHVQIAGSRAYREGKVTDQGILLWLFIQQSSKF